MNKITETTLSIIKPNAYAKATEIISMIEKLDQVKTTTMKIVNFTKEQAAEFYDEHKERDTFQTLIEFTSSGPSLAVVIKGPDVIRRYRELMPQIRKQYSDPLDPLSFIKNTVHGSDSVESFTREMKIIGL